MLWHCSVNPDSWFFFFVIQVSRHPLQRWLSLNKYIASHRTRLKSQTTPPLTIPLPNSFPPGAPSFGLEILVDFSTWQFGPLDFFLFLPFKFPLPSIPIKAEHKAHSFSFSLSFSLQHLIVWSQVCHVLYRTCE